MELYTIFVILWEPFHRITLLCSPGSISYALKQTKNKRISVCLICSFELPVHSVDCWPLERGKLITYLYAKQNSCKSVGKTAESNDHDADDSSVFYLQLLSRKIIQHKMYKCKKNNRKRKYIHAIFLCVITLLYSSLVYNYVSLSLFNTIK